MLKGALPSRVSLLESLRLVSFPHTFLFDSLLILRQYRMISNDFLTLLNGVEIKILAFLGNAQRF